MSPSDQTHPEPIADRVLRLRHDLRLLSGRDIGRRTASENALLRGLGAASVGRKLLDFLATPGSGGGLVALSLCCDACRRGGEFVVIDPGGAFNALAAIGWGADAERLLVVSPQSERKVLTAVEVALRSPSVAAVWATVGQIDGKAYRRLLLASETGGAFGVLVRPVGHQASPSWADVQLRFDPLPTPQDPDSPLRVLATQTRNRHGPAGGQAMLAIDWRTGRVEELPPRADAEAS